MTREELRLKIHTIVSGYMADLDNHKTKREIEDILITHFNNMATSPHNLDNTYFEEEYNIWSNK